MGNIKKKGVKLLGGGKKKSRAKKGDVFRGRETTAASSIEERGCGKVPGIEC